MALTFTLNGLNTVTVITQQQSPNDWITACLKKKKKKKMVQLEMLF